ncbi:MAG: hypothetical protein AB8B72_11410 [Crocinitomicaceae bacterium]
MIIPLKNQKNVSILIAAFIGLAVVSCGGAEMDRKDKVAAIVGALQDPFLSATLTPQIFIDKSGIEDGALPFAYQTITSFLISENKTGIANNEQMQIIVENSTGMVPNAFAFIPLHDQSLFKKLIESELGESTEKNGVSYIRKDKDNYVLAWKDDLAIVTNIPLSLDNLFSKGTNESKKVATRLVNLLNGVSKKAINNDFRAFFDKEGDVLLYANGNSAYEIIEGMRFISNKEKAEYKEMLSGTVLESALNFENGKITLTSDYDIAEGLEAYFNVLKSEGLSDEMLSFGFSPDPIMAVSLNLSLKDVVKVLNMQRELFEVDDIERDLAKMNFKLSEIDDLLTGEMLVMFDSLVVTERSYTDYKGVEKKYTNEEPIFGTVVGVKNEKRVAELIAQSLPEGIEPGRLGKEYYAIKNNKLFITNSEEWMAAFKTGKTVSINNGDGFLSSGPIGIQMKSNMADQLELGLDELESLNGQITNMLAKATDAGMEMTIQLKDDNINSLRLIVESLLEEIEKENLRDNSALESIIDGELMEQFEEDASESIKEILNSEEVKNLQEALENF